MIRREFNRDRDPRHQKELLWALERARSRLAVAMAAENKVTPRDRWRHYLETEDRMRKLVRQLRTRYGGSCRKQLAWLQVMDTLNQPIPASDDPAQGEASALCARLHHVLEILDR